MSPSFVYEPPSALATACLRHRQTLREQMNLGLKAKVLFRELSDLAVL
jgi:hypothetical protein